VVDDEDPKTRAILDDQIAYYRRRAQEYDETSAPPNDPWAADTDRIRDELRSFAPSGRVLEIACGTGQWTRLLAQYADRLTALDASPEMLRLNSIKVGDPRIRYVEADVFEFHPESLVDVVFFGFWISHVPPERFEAFWRNLQRCLAPAGRVFFVDETRHGLWDEDYIGGRGSTLVRRLTDGSIHRVVKVLWMPDELETRLRELGWNVAVHGVGPFYWGAGTPPGRDVGRPAHPSV
jgi:demethylmenaquinone methyltransferase/2-methoxy-6-polyprenyl-1,4-benzoquinol methylase